MKTRTITMSLKQDITEMIEKYAKFAWILHDKDTDSDTGEVKEPHYHYYLEFPNPRELKSVAKEFDIPENMVEAVRDKKGILKYFTHSTDASKSKYEYDISEIHCSFDITEVTKEVDIESIYEILKGAKSESDAIRSIKSLRLGGNPLISLKYLLDIYYKIHR